MSETATTQTPEAPAQSLTPQEATPGADGGSGAQFSYDDLVSDAVDWSDSSKKAEPEAPAAEEVEPQQVSKEKEEKKVEAKPKKAESSKTDKKIEFTAKTADGKTITLSGDTKFLKTIEGQEREVSLDDALKHFAFDVNYTKKYQELSEGKKAAEELTVKAQEKEAKAEKAFQIIGMALRETGEAVEKGDANDFLSKFSEMTQIPRVKLDSVLRAHYIPIIQKYLDADESERKLLDAEEQTNYLKEKEAKLTSKEQKRERLQTCVAYASKMANQANLSGEEWKAAETRVIKEYLGGQSPDFSDPQITDYHLREYVDSVIAVAREAKVDAQVSSLISKVSPELLKEGGDELEELKQTIAPFIGKLDEAELVQVLKSAISPSAEDEEDEDVEVLDDKAKKPRQNAPSKVDADDIDDNPLSVYS